MDTPLRDSKAWADLGLPMSTPSNEACKKFDAVVRGFTGSYTDPSGNDLGQNLMGMLAADENFVMGHVASIGGEVLGAGINLRRNPALTARVHNLLKLSEKEFVLDRERRHADAVKLFADGKMKEAAYAWDDIMIEYPRDPLALQCSHLAHFYTGQQRQHRDIISRIIPYWDVSMPFYDDVIGYQAFGFAETSRYDRAAEIAKRGLELNAKNIKASHTFCHVYEMTGRYKEGRAFMKQTENDWCDLGVMSCHLYWHWALFDMEEGIYDDAIKVFDAEISKRMKSGAMLNICDASSLLFRLEMEGIYVKDRWKEVYDLCLPHKEDHFLVFNDAHLLMAFLSSKDSDLVKEFMTSLKEFASTYVNDNATLSKRIGISLCEALVAYSEGQYGKTVNLLSPIRYEVKQIGGSDAQRDTFDLLLIAAAIRSSCKKHQCFARQLLIERKTLRENSPLSDRLLENVASVSLQ